LHVRRRAIPPGRQVKIWSIVFAAKPSQVIPRLATKRNYQSVLDPNSGELLRVAVRKPQVSPAAKAA
jgi:hypothetical protein